METADTFVLNLPTITPLKFSAASQPSSELLALWRQTVWGTEQTLYRIPDAESFLHLHTQGHFCELRLDDSLIGGLFTIEKPLAWNGFLIRAHYQGLLAIDRQSQGLGYGRELLQRANNHLCRDRPTPTLFYAYIEADNVRSLRLFRSEGYQEIGHFFTTTFSRFQPRYSTRLNKLEPSGKSNLVKLMNILYQGHELRDFDLSISPDQYFVLREGGRIVAGLQADLQRWTILSLGGAGGWLARILLPHIPFIRGLFNPRDFRFLKFSNLYIDPNRPESIVELMEAVLARHSLKTALMFWDERSLIYKHLATVTRFGLLNPLTRTEVKLMVRPLGIDSHDLDRLRDTPLVISPSDP